MLGERTPLTRAWFLAITLGLVGGLTGAWASTGAQIVVYLEVPAGVAAEAKLGVARVALRGESTAEPLEPLTRDLASTDLAGRQLRFVDEVVPAGFYEGLEIEFDRLEVSSGKAMVRPDPPSEPLRLPLDLQLMGGGAALVVVQWTPTAIDPESEDSQPQLQIMIPEVPPLGAVAFVTNEGSGNVSVVGLSSRRVVDVVRTGAGPRGMVYSRARQRLYVANSEDDSIALIDGPTRRLIRTTTTNFGDEPSRLSLSPDERQLYVLNWGSDVISVLDAETLQETARTYIGQEPRGMDVDPISGFVYVASELALGIRVFDPARPEREILLPAEVAPSEVVFDRPGNRLHVSGSSQRTLSVLSVQTQTVVERINLCSSAVGLAYDPRARRLYASLEDCSEVVILSPDAGLEVDSVRLDDPPGLLSLGPDNRELLVTSPESGELLFYNVNSLQRVGTATVGDRPYMAVVPR